MAFWPCRYRTHQTAYFDREARAVRKAFKHKRQPTAEQQRALDQTLRLCRTLYLCALEQRRT
jgi:hypothetical protein